MKYGHIRGRPRLTFPEHGDLKPEDGDGIYRDPIEAMLPDNTEGD
jgi:hypothetical protein